jgi:hypothetical protein
MFQLVLHSTDVIEERDAGDHTRLLAGRKRQVKKNRSRKPEVRRRTIQFSEGI